MAQSKLLLDTNVVIDYLNEREPYYEKAALLMIGGRVGEFELWISSSQVTDLVYILSNGGRTSEMDAVMGQLRGLRIFVNVFAASEREVDLCLPPRGTTQRTTSFTKSPWRLGPMSSSRETSPTSPKASFPS